MHELWLRCECGLSMLPVGRRMSDLVAIGAAAIAVAVVAGKGRNSSQME